MFISLKIGWLAMGFYEAYYIRFCKVCKFWQSFKKLIKLREYGIRTEFSFGL
jgi:hypothetical protein